MRPEIRRLTAEQVLSLLAAVRPTLTRKITAVHLHHTWRPTRAQFRGLATIEAMRKYHLGLGWDDIAQHLTIDPVGIAWTGRNWNLPPASQKGSNGTAAAGPFMIEMVGDFDAGRDVLDGAQRASVCRIVAGILAEYGLDPGAAVKFHRELGAPKTCPGSGVDKAQLIADIRAALPAAPRGAQTTNGRSSAASRRAAAARTAGTPSALPLPIAYLVSRDVAAPVDGVAAGFEDGTVGEDGVSARGLSLETAARTGDAAIELSASLARSRGEWDDLRPFVVNLSEGKLSRGGKFKMDDESIAHIIERIHTYAETTETPRLMLHAHGGLVSETSALTYARAAHTWWLDHGVYPIYFIWETGAFEVIRNKLGLGRGIGDWWDRRFERFARPLCKPLWDDMKDYALRSSAENAGGGEPGGARTFAIALRSLIDNQPEKRKLALHAVGHSAGAIFHSHFVPLLCDEGQTVESLSFLAPAVRIDLFTDMVLPRLGKGITRFAMYTMDEEAEKDDDLIEPLGVPVYGKSLLYLVSNAFEPEEKKAAILGLDERFRSVKAITDLFRPTGPHSLEFSHARGKPHNPATHARMHGCFDNDNATMTSVLAAITGLTTTVPFPVAGRKCDKAASRPRGLALDDWRVTATPPLPSPASRSGSVNGTRKALCVGIDNYPDSPLAGCVADARAWARALTGLDFAVTSVLDREATRQRLLDALGHLISGARPGDTLVFQYAGHGSQVEDLNGDESDRFDETLVPIDYSSGALLTDDDLAAIYRQVPTGVTLTLFMDCCHSGTNSRFAPVDRSRARGDERRRFLELPSHVEDAHRRFRARAGAPPSMQTETSWPGVIHFAACLDDQYAYESGGQGHFTGIATGLLAAAVAATDTNEGFAREVERKVTALGRPQTPRLMPVPSGASDRPLLSGAAGTGGIDAAVSTPMTVAGALDDRALAEWWLQFFETSATQLRQRLGR